MKLDFHMERRDVLFTVVVVALLLTALIYVNGSTYPPVSDDKLIYDEKADREFQERIVGPDRLEWERRQREHQQRERR